MSKRGLTILLGFFIFTGTFQVSAYEAKLIPPPARGPRISRLNADEGGIAVSNNKFALSMYHRLRHENDNLFFSPVSIITALAMTMSGSDNETRKQMAQALFLDQPFAQIPQYFQKYLEQIDQIQSSGKVKLSMANAIWVNENFAFQPDFIDQLRECFLSDANPVDFQNDAEAIRVDINDWIARKTADLIKDMLSHGTPDADTMMMLVNAIYFKGDWDSKFEEYNTRSEPFYLDDGSESEVKLMHQQADFLVARFVDYDVIKLPYVGKEVSMLVLLPHKGQSLSDIEDSLSDELIKQVQANFNQYEVKLYLPRFKLEFGAVALNDYLMELGMKDAFNVEKADFFPMFDSFAENERLFISKVMHKAFVDVNESGTEAAAATFVGMSRESVADAPPPLIFRADRPFIFIISEDISSSILFMGRYCQP